jgi:hypothetical protein
MEYRIHFQATFEVDTKEQLAHILETIEPVIKRKGTEVRTIVFPPEQEKMQT